MIAVGVPPTLVIANQMECLSQRVENIQQQLMKQQETLLETTEGKLSDLPIDVANHLRITLITVLLRLLPASLQHY